MNLVHGFVDYPVALYSLNRGYVPNILTLRAGKNSGLYFLLDYKFLGIEPMRDSTKLSTHSHFIANQRNILH